VFLATTVGTQSFDHADCLDVPSPFRLQSDSVPSHSLGEKMSIRPDEEPCSAATSSFAAFSEHNSTATVFPINATICYEKSGGTFLRIQTLPVATGNSSFYHQSFAV
jgi:hypothetical protein